MIVSRKTKHVDWLGGKLKIIKKSDHINIINITIAKSTLLIINIEK